MKTGVSRRAFYLLLCANVAAPRFTKRLTLELQINCGKIPVILLIYTFLVMRIILHLVNLKKSCKSAQ